MPLTTPKGYRFPTSGQTPDVPRDIRNLAEDVNNANAATDIEIAGIDQRLATVEAQSVPGWTYIGHGQNQGAAFDIDVTGGGVFPAGTFGMVKLYARYDLDGDGTVRLRVNNRTGIHNTAMTTWDNLGQFDGNFSFNVSDDDQWFIGQGGTSSVNNLEVIIHHTNEASSLPYRAVSVRQSANRSVARNSVAWGFINGTELLTVINMRPFTDNLNEFADFRWWLEGFRLP